MRVVVDTNVLLSAALRDRLPETVVKRVLGSDAHHWIVSAEMLEEYEQVLRRPRFGLAGADIEFWTQAVQLHGLERSGLVTCQDEVVGGKLRKYYRATAKGRRSLAEVKDKIQELVGELLEE